MSWIQDFKFGHQVKGNLAADLREPADGKRMEQFYYKRKNVIER